MKKNIMENEQVFNKSYNTFCYQNCLKYVLESYSVQNAEFYINKAMTMIVGIGGLLEINLYYDYRARSLLPVFSDKVRKYYPDRKDCHAVFEDNLEEIKKGKPIIVDVDSYFLPYSPYYLNSHGCHSLILVDYNEVTDEVLVVDWMEPWCYKGSIKLENFLEARDSENDDDGGMFCGNPIQNNWAELDCNGWDKTTEELIYNTIHLSLDQYYFPFGEDINEVKGVEALKYISNNVAQLENYSEEEQNKYLDRLHRTLFSINRRREFWEDFLLQVKKVAYSQELGRLIEENQVLIESWEKLLYLVIKLGMRRKPGYARGLAAQMDEVIEAEKEYGEELKTFYITLSKHLRC